jgi:hypothetical protein
MKRCDIEMVPKATGKLPQVLGSDKDAVDKVGIEIRPAPLEHRLNKAKHPKESEVQRRGKFEKRS